MSTLQEHEQAQPIPTSRYPKWKYLLCADCDTLVCEYYHRGTEAPLIPFYFARLGYVERVSSGIFTIRGYQCNCRSTKLHAYHVQDVNEIVNLARYNGGRFY